MLIRSDSVEADFSTLAVYTCRYVMNRMTYAPSDVKSIIKCNVDRISLGDLTAIILDVSAACDERRAGDDNIDRPEWIKFIRWMQSVISEREGDSYAKDHFELFLKYWKQDRNRYSKYSDLDDMIELSSYQRIIGMGERAVPFILDELRKEPDHWFPALNAITGENPVPKESEGNLAKMTEAWLEWGKAQKTD